MENAIKIQAKYYSFNKFYSNFIKFLMCLILCQNIGFCNSFFFHFRGTECEVILTVKDLVLI